MISEAYEINKKNSCEVFLNDFLARQILIEKPTDNEEESRKEENEYGINEGTEDIMYTPIITKSRSRDSDASTEIQIPFSKYGIRFYFNG